MFNQASAGGGRTYVRHLSIGCFLKALADAGPADEQHVLAALDDESGSEVDDAHLGDLGLKVK